MTTPPKPREKPGTEISGWGKMTNDERRDVLKHAVRRAREQGLLN